MTDLKLVTDEPTPLERMLLDASRAELPSEDHRARVRAALGIGVPLSSPPPALDGASKPAAAAGTTAPVGGASAAAAGTRFAALGKIAVGIAVTALVGLFMFARHDRAPAPPAAVKPPAPTLLMAPTAAHVVQPPVMSAPPPVVEVTAPQRPVRADASAAATDLSAQIRLIEAARAAVAVRDAAAALAALDTYSAKFPRGSFGQEAMVLRIRALEQAGKFSQATALAKTFVARFPNSPHVARLQPIARRVASL